jgi:hypothetical protein
MISSIKLPFYFEPKPLQLELEQIALPDWTPHFNTGYYEGDWSGVALRSVGGEAGRLYSDPRATDSVADTPIFDRCPNVRALVSSLQCPLRSIRFLKLGPGSRIREHRDYDLGFDEGQVRLHIPILTNTAVDFVLDAHRIEMKEGECWYLDLSLPHWVENRGSRDRVHLVIDCDVNEWLRTLLEAAVSESALAVASAPQHECPSSTAEWERFRQAVFNDNNLQQRLRATSDLESFSRLVVCIGLENGYQFNADDVAAALRVARVSWIQRWTD